ncbi:MAG: putative NADP-dependent oxidoreductase YfmJ [Alphaproteobacteria bacterium MarineAlpha9_Bin4]|nr:NADP-dependent oxidoreductase [Pelagibacterales bacterium]PPR26858.1 MAG: putative NADP-dependent oxidoreductase YfmJ [Alphaproteobacteria bacterium MarineAlpha9_Bin4]|tara:strand:- start:2330 stop:3340 length:1011 start_codon:yes stop_codon:yes gene_type:complete
MKYTNQKIVLKNRPVGFPSINDFEIVNETIETINYGEVIVKILWLSLDPYMRGRMSEAKSYALPLQLGDVITGGAVGKVVFSNCPKYKQGDIVEGFTLGWQEYAKISTNNIRKIDTNLAPIQTAVGVLGMPGMTAYFGLFEVCKPIPGDNVVVSAASGAVGQLVGQLAKIAGCNVIGIAGTEEKCKYIKKILNFDEVINYKKDNVYKKVKEYCPDGVNIYFDNVGGKISDDVISNIAPFGRIGVCGVISQYNLTEMEAGMRVQRAVLTNQASVEGFLVFRFEQRYPIARKRMASWLSKGQLIWKEDIVNGLDKAPEAFIGLMKGKNFGKLLIKVSD